MITVHALECLYITDVMYSAWYIVYAQKRLAAALAITIFIIIPQRKLVNILSLC